MPLLFIPDFKNGDKNMETFLKDEQISYSKDNFENYRKKISNSSKMKPLLNASKAWQTVPAGSLSARPM